MLSVVAALRMGIYKLPQQNEGTRDAQLTHHIDDGRSSAPDLRHQKRCSGVARYGSNTSDGIWPAGMGCCWMTGAGDQ